LLKRLLVFVFFYDIQRFIATFGRLIHLSLLFIEIDHIINGFENLRFISPEAVGIDALAWTPAFVQQFLDETYGVEYSLPSCRRLLKEAGLSYQKPRRSAAEADESEQEVFHDELKKKQQEMDATVV